MAAQSANLTLNLRSRWLSGSVGGKVIAQVEQLGLSTPGVVEPGTYHLVRAQNGQAARGIIIEGSKGSTRSIIIEGGKGSTRSIIIEGGKGSTRSIIIEGSKGGEWLDALDALDEGTLAVQG